MSTRSVYEQAEISKGRILTHLIEYKYNSCYQGITIDVKTISLAHH